MKRIIALLAAVAILVVLAACGTTETIPHIDDTLYHISAQTRDNIIVPAGNFWEDWWNLRGAFAPEHIGEGSDDPVFAELQPTSGFGSLAELRTHLLQWYTPAWLDANLHYHFIEEDGVLLVATARAGIVRADWSTAQIVTTAPELTVLVTFGAWHREPGEQYPHDVTYRFTFVDGRIDMIERVHAATPE